MNKAGPLVAPREVEEAAMEAVLPPVVAWVLLRLRQPASVRQLHTESGLPKKFLRRLLYYLEAHGYVERYRLKGGGWKWVTTDGLFGGGEG